MKPEATASVEDLQLLLICSFRYALGRRSYMPSLVAEIVQRHVSVLTPFDRAQMIEDIIKAVEAGRAGDSCDVATWKHLADWLQEQNDG